jgi:integrase
MHMPRPATDYPKITLHKASGRARVRLSGKTFYLGKFGSRDARKEYDRLITEWVQNGRVRPPGAKPAASPSDEPEQTGASVHVLLAAFWKHAEKYYRRPDGTATGELFPIKSAFRFVRHLYGKIPARDFSPLKLQAVRQKMIDAGMARSTINNNCQRIVRAFRWACSQEMVPGSVIHALESVTGLRRGRTDARESQPIEPIADDVVQKTLPHVSTIVADMIRLQRLTGMRPAEVCSLRPRNVDTSGDVWVYAPATHKTAHHGKPRVVAIGPRGQAILRPYLLRGADAFCFSPRQSELKRREEAHSQRVTPLGYGNRPGTNRKAGPGRTPGECYTTDSYRRAIERGCEIAFGMSDDCVIPYGVELPQEKVDAIRQRAKAWRAEHCWTPNQLRHSAATEIRQRFGLEAAQVTLGHANANVTQVYAERDLAKAMQVAREVG